MILGGAVWRDRCDAYSPARPEGRTCAMRGPRWSAFYNEHADLVGRTFAGAVHAL